MAKQYSLDLTDFKTAAELNTQRLKLARIANRRLRELEAAGRDYWAYDRATDYTQRSRGSNRYSQKKEWNGTVEGLKQELEELISFLNSKTSTVSGSRALENQIITKHKSKGRTLTDPQSYFNFLQSDMYKKLANKYISSEKLQDYFDRRIEDGDSQEVIVNALQEFLDDEIHDVAELFESAGYSLLDENDD